MLRERGTFRLVSIGWKHSTFTHSDLSEKIRDYIDQINQIFATTRIHGTRKDSKRYRYQSVPMLTIGNQLGENFKFF
jgi:hypothetical protein